MSTYKNPKKSKVAQFPIEVPFVSSIYNPELGCRWNNLKMIAHGSDITSFLFESIHLPLLQKAFEEGSAYIKSLKQISENELQTDEHHIRIYHLGFQLNGCKPFVFIRNETIYSVDNWAIYLNSSQSCLPGDYIDYPLRSYTDGEGGLRADLFLVNRDVLMSSSLGTHSFVSCTNAHNTIFQLEDLPIYYIELQFSKHLRYAFALELQH